MWHIISGLHATKNIKWNLQFFLLGESILLLSAEKRNERPSNPGLRPHFSGFLHSHRVQQANNMLDTHLHEWEEKVGESILLLSAEKCNKRPSNPGRRPYFSGFVHSHRIQQANNMLAGHVRYPFTWMTRKSAKVWWASHNNTCNLFFQTCFPLPRGCFCIINCSS